MSISPIFKIEKEGGYFSLNFSNEYTNKEQLEEIGLISQLNKLYDDTTSNKQETNNLIKKRLLEFYKENNNNNLLNTKNKKKQKEQKPVLELDYLKKMGINIIGDDLCQISAPKHLIVSFRVENDSPSEIDNLKKSYESFVLSLSSLSIEYGIKLNNILVLIFFKELKDLNYNYLYGNKSYSIIHRYQAEIKDVPFFYSFLSYTCNDKLSNVANLINNNNFENIDNNINNQSNTVNIIDNNIKIVGIHKPFLTNFSIERCLYMGILPHIKLHEFENNDINFPLFLLSVKAGTLFKNNCILKLYNALITSEEKFDHFLEYNQNLVYISSNKNDLEIKNNDNNTNKVNYENQNNFNNTDRLDINKNSNITSNVKPSDVFYSNNNILSIGYTTESYIQGKQSCCRLYSSPLAYEHTLKSTYDTHFNNIQNSFDIPNSCYMFKFNMKDSNKIVDYFFEKSYGMYNTLDYENNIYLHYMRFPLFLTNTLKKEIVYVPEAIVELHKSKYEYWNWLEDSNKITATKWIKFFIQLKLLLCFCNKSIKYKCYNLMFFYNIILTFISFIIPSLINIVSYFIFTYAFNNSAVAYTLLLIYTILMVMTIIIYLTGSISRLEIPLYIITLFFGIYYYFTIIAAIPGLIKIYDSYINLVNTGALATLIILNFIFLVIPYFLHYNKTITLSLLSAKFITLLFFFNYTSMFVFGAFSFMFTSKKAYLKASFILVYLILIFLFSTIIYSLNTVVNFKGMLGLAVIFTLLMAFKFVFILIDFFLYYFNKRLQVNLPKNRAAIKSILSSYLILKDNGNIEGNNKYNSDNYKNDSIAKKIYEVSELENSKLSTNKKMNEMSRVDSSIRDNVSSKQYTNNNINNNSINNVNHLKSNRQSNKLNSKINNEVINTEADINVEILDNANITNNSKNNKPKNYYNEDELEYDSNYESKTVNNIKEDYSKNNYDDNSIINNNDINNNNNNSINSRKNNSINKSYIKHNRESNISNSLDNENKIANANYDKTIPAIDHDLDNLEIKDI